MSLFAGCYELTDRFRVGAPLDDVWRFFSTAENLPLITPAWLKFTILTPVPIVLAKDVLLDYSISPLGFALKWRTRILGWEPPHRFVDLQEKGPYALWHHEHVFEQTNGGTHCFDRVLYRLPLEPVGRLMHVVVRRQLQQIFEYRWNVIAQHLGGVEPRKPEVRIRRLTNLPPLDDPAAAIDHPHP